MKEFVIEPLALALFDSAKEFYRQAILGGEPEEFLSYIRDIQSICNFIESCLETAIANREEEREGER